MALPLLVHALLLLQAGRVSWTAPSSCPPEAAVEARVAELTSTADADEIVADAIVRVRDGKFVVELAVQVDERRFMRELEAQRCEALAEAVALVIATAADPLASAAALREPAATARAPTIPPPAATAEDPVVVASTTSEPAPARDARSRPAIRLVLGTGVGVEAGAMPGPTGSVSGFMGLERDRLRVEVGGTYFIRRPASLDAGRGATVGLGTGTLRGCGRLGATRLFVLCLGAEGGAMRGDAFGIRDGRTRTEPWAAAIGSAGVHGAVSRRVRLFARAEVAVALVQPRFELRPRGQDIVVVHDPGPVSARVAAGIEIAFTVTKAQAARE
jgi:hypothetical protein